MDGHGFQFSADGIEVLEGIWTEETISLFEQALIGRADSMLESIESGLSIRCESPYQKLRHLEAKAPGLFYELCTGVGGCLAGMRLAMAPKVQDFLAGALSKPADGLFFTIPAIFWNDKEVTRLQYQWHQEASYLQAYSQGFHLWAPLFRDLSESDGPMLVLPGSHLRGRLPYTASSKPNGLTQLTVSDSDIAQYKPFACTLTRGSAVMFHHAMVHCTGPNLSGSPRASVIIRYFDTTDEPSLKAPLVFKNPLSREEIMKRDMTN